MTISKQNSLQHLLNQYSESHQNSLNQKIHKICVPLIEWSVLGIFSSLPKPQFFESLNWAHVIVFLALAYYSQFKNLKVILATLILMAPFWIFLGLYHGNVLSVSLIVFVLAWIGQFYGHKIEGKKPSFFEDLFFLLIGPLWVAEALLRTQGKTLNK